MLSFPSSVRVFLAVDPVDMRKSFNGLYGVVREQLKRDPQEGGLYVFSNRRRDRLKILFWDGSGLWVLAKRLEQGRFSWPKGVDVRDGRLTIKHAALSMLLEGVDLKNGMQKAWYEG